MATQDHESLILLLAWGHFAAAIRGEASREVSRGAVRAWLESGSPLAAERQARMAPAQRRGWLDDAAREVAGMLARLCCKPEPGGGTESGNNSGRPVWWGTKAGLPCFFAFPVGPDPYVPGCARCLWPRVGRCGGRVA